MSEKIVKELAPYFVSTLHSDRIRRYIELYKNSHQGQEPSEQQINNLVTIMVAQGTLEKDAENIARGFIKKIKKENRVKHLLSNLSLSIPICLLLELLAIVLLVGKVPEYLKSTAVYYPILFTLALSFFALLVHMVISTIKND